MDDLEHTLANITMAPYIVKAMALIGVKRKGGSNMFRHQISTMGILLDYKIVDAVLLKAACIHDLFEDAVVAARRHQGRDHAIDEDGPAVYDLVMEVTMRTIDGMRESKAEYLTRLMLHGIAARQGPQARRPHQQHDRAGLRARRRFVRRFVAETRQFVLPYAAAINADMHRELSAPDRKPGTTAGLAARRARPARAGG